MDKLNTQTKLWRNISVYIITLIYKVFRKYYYIYFGLLGTTGVVIWNSMKLMRNEEVLVLRLTGNCNGVWSTPEEDERVQMSDIVR